MKFIINSDYFRRRLEDALNVGANWIETRDRDLVITAGNHACITMQIHALERSDESMAFDCQKWQKVVDTLKQMPEQPITVELNYRTIEIYCVLVMTILDDELEIKK